MSRNNGATDLWTLLSAVLLGVLPILGRFGRTHARSITRLARVFWVLALVTCVGEVASSSAGLGVGSAVIAGCVSGGVVAITLSVFLPIKNPCGSVFRDPAAVLTYGTTLGRENCHGCRRFGVIRSARLPSICVLVLPRSAFS